MNNRIIKFRAFDKRPERREMIYDIQDGSDLCGQFFGEFLNYPNTYEIMQFTGLFDINRREIYEGDIVIYDTGNVNENIEYKNLLTSIVFWEERGWRIRYSADYYSWNKMKIIGNIFENPEIIK